MSRSRSRLAADWFTKLRPNATTGDVEHEEVVAAATNVTGTTTASIPTTALASGTANSGTFLRGDRVWVSLSTETIIGLKVYTSSGTWTKPSGCSKVKVTVVGGGGNGGYGYSSGDNAGAGGGGGAGGVAIDVIDVSAVSSISVTVGGAGGTSSFGSYCSATGGATGAAGNNGTAAGGAGGTGVGGIFNVTSSSGDASVKLGTYVATSGAGGNTSLGFGSGGLIVSVRDVGGMGEYGKSGIGFGAGGSGGASEDGQNRPGGAGAPGLVIIEEFA